MDSLFLKRVYLTRVLLLAKSYTDGLITLVLYCVTLFWLGLYSAAINSFSVTVTSVLNSFDIQIQRKYE